MNIEQALTLGSSLIAPTSASPRLDAEVIYSHLKQYDRSSLLARTKEKINIFELIVFLFYIWQRRRGKPVAYITGLKEFYGRTFKVNKHTLIPRPDTEILIQTVINLVQQNNNVTTIADIGTGSGCIAITLAHELPHLKIIASDISSEVLTVAKQNASEQKIISKIEFCQGDLLKPLILNNKLSPQTLIVANLPYLKPQEYSDGLLYEPKKALVSRPNGLQHYYDLFKQISNLPNEKRPSHLALEINPLTTDEFKELTRIHLPGGKIDIIKDLSRFPRVVVVTI